MLARWCDANRRSEDQLRLCGKFHQLLAANDVDPPLIAAYIGEAEYQAISDYRGLTESAVVSMYVARLIDRPQAASILSALHVSAPAAQLELDYADLRYVIDSINKSVQRISTLFTGRKIGADTARRAFLTLGIPPATVDDLLTDLTIQAQANVKILTETQIVDAWAKAIYDTPEALGELEAIGYTPFDAWTVLSIKAGGPLPGKPPATIAAPAGPVIPGTT